MLEETTNVNIKGLNNSVDILTELSEQNVVNHHSLRLMQVQCKHIKRLAEKIEQQLEEKLSEISVPLSKRERKIIAQGTLKHDELLEP